MGLFDSESPSWLRLHFAACYFSLSGAPRAREPLQHKTEARVEARYGGRNSFEKPVKSKTVEANILSFFNLSYPDICKFICKNLQSTPITIEYIATHYLQADVIFCVKQLIEYKIISKSSHYLLRGSQFDNYLKFILKEST